MRTGLEHEIEELAEKLLGKRSEFNGEKIRQLTNEELDNLRGENLSPEVYSFVEGIYQEFDEMLEDSLVKLMERKLAKVRPDDLTNKQWCEGFWNIIHQLNEQEP